ncbi:MAG TPA: hypothetical protein VMZ04_02115 [Anaerolineae bacterium]|nr:hypothetical protein [Anaerolineae bacterium]
MKKELSITILKGKKVYITTCFRYPKSDLISVMAMKAEEVHIIGDCRKVGQIREATEAGEYIGRWL